MTIAAIIVAAGSGTRLGGAIPKQFQQIGGQMILRRTISALARCKSISRIVCVINPRWRAAYDEAAADLDARLMPPVAGGSDRAGSVFAGLQALADDPPDRVLIHDGARPFVLVSELQALCDWNGAAILAQPVVDALWREETGNAATTVPRDGLWRAQTPQAFPFAEILDAHQAVSQDPPALDDAEVFRRAGGDVHLIPGGPDNFKITTAEDLTRAERLLRSRNAEMETRVGQGFDVHIFGPGDGIWLCGVKIPHNRALVGHSDADVGLHALADAIYGALAEGDIGRHFPPSDPQWKGAESHIFLSHAADMVAARGGRIVNVDMTMLCEAPKIAPHSGDMRARLAQILGIDETRVSIKATTMERMGFVGREEGMGCMANATIALPVTA